MELLLFFLAHTSTTLLAFFTSIVMSLCFIFIVTHVFFCVVTVEVRLRITHITCKDRKLSVIPLSYNLCWAEFSLKKNIENRKLYQFQPDDFGKVFHCERQIFDVRLTLIYVLLAIARNKIF